MVELPSESVTNALTEVLRHRARQLLAGAVEREVADTLAIASIGETSLDTDWSSGMDTFLSGRSRRALATWQ